MTIHIINALTGGVSTYSIDAYGVGNASGVFGGLGPSGVFYFDAAASGTFNPYIRTGQLMPLPGQEYNVPMALVTLKGEGRLTLTSTMERLGAVETETGAASGKVALAQYEIPLSRSKECRSYQFEVELAAGQELRGVDIAINPVRVRKV